MPVSVVIPEADLAKLESYLSQLDIFAKGPAVKRVLRKAISVVGKRARELAPPAQGYKTPGYEGGEHPAKLSEAKAYKTSSGEAEGLMYAKVFGAPPSLVPHFHLVEFGHKTVTGGTIARTSGRTAAESRRTGERGKGTVKGFVEGRPFLGPAARDTLARQRQILVSELIKEIAKANKGA